MSVSINKVLLGNSNIYYLHIVYGCLCLPQSTAYKEKLSSWDRDQMAHKA